MQCQQCNSVVDTDSKFCPHCGTVISEAVVENERKRITATKPIQKLVSFGNGVISFIVGFFAFTIIKVIFSFLLILFVKMKLLSVVTYNEYGFIFIFISLYLAVVVIKKLNKFKTKKTRIILKIAIIIIGFISGVLLGMNNSLVHNQSFGGTKNQTLIDN